MTHNLEDERLLVKSQRCALGNPAVPFVNMTSRAARIVPGTPLGERLLDAILSEGRTVQGLQEELQLSQGHIGRIIRGERWKETVDVEVAKTIAAKLHVNFLWLVLGEGPRRRDGRGETPAEQAMAFARTNGAREDAVQLAWERNKDREQEMEVLDWVLAISTEAARLNSSGVPRPEAVLAKQRAIGRVGARKRAQKQRPEDAKVPPMLPAANKTRSA